MPRPNYLGTFPGDMREARRYSCAWRSAKEKEATHRKFRRRERQLLRSGIDPAPRMAVGWYL